MLGDFAALNGKEFAAEGKSPNTFQIDCDTTSFQKFEGAGWWKQIKAPAVFEMVVHSRLIFNEFSNL